MLLNLPSELLLSILKHLPVADIAACRATGHVFNSFIDQHESTVYRQAAAHPDLRLIPNEYVLFQEIPSLGWHSGRFLGRAQSWKDLCRRACEVRSSWRGRAPSHIRNHKGTLPNVHRIKVDEKRGFFVVTTQEGGLTVVDINGDDPIWWLPQTHVRPCAHCEYGEGFLIFDRFGITKEVWRLVSDDPAVNPPGEFDVVPESLPDTIQQHIATVPVRPGSNARLKFVPHALLRPPNDIRTHAYRFVYPTLLTAAHESLILWDVRTGRLVEQIEDIQRPIAWGRNASSADVGGVQGADISADGGGSATAPTFTPGSGFDTNSGTVGVPDNELTGTSSAPQVSSAHPAPPEDEDGLGSINYVEVNDKYAFVCGSNSLRVFRHRNGAQNDANSGGEDGGVRKTADCVLELGQSHIKDIGRWFFRVGYVKQRNSDLMSPTAPSTSSIRYESGEDQSLLGNSIPGPSSTGNEDVDMIEVNASEDDEDDQDSQTEALYKQWYRHTIVGNSDARDRLKKGIWRKNDKAIVSHEIFSSQYNSSGLLHKLRTEDSEYEAVHVSSCGQHLAALLSGSRLFIIPYFERVVTGQVNDVSSIKIDIQLNVPVESVYLAYENGRIGVVTQMAVFIIHPTFPDPSDFDTPPELEVHRVMRFNNFDLLHNVTCLQMTSTALWLNWEKRDPRMFFGLVFSRFISLGLFRDRQVEYEQCLASLDREVEREDAIYEEAFEASTNTWDVDFPSVGRNIPENSFVFSVDFGLES